MASKDALLAARPWLKFYPAEVPAEIDLAAVPTVAGVIERAFRDYPARAAFESFGKRLSYAEVERAARRITAWLQQRGYAKGDRIAMMMPNVMAYPVAMFGALIGGYAVVNVNPLYTARELVHQIKDSGARALFVLENFGATVEEALPDLRLDDVVLCAPGDLLGLKGHVVNFVSRHIKKGVKPFSLPRARRLSEVLATAVPARPVTVTGEDIAFLQYTGGTTGVAKGAVLLHRNVGANLQQCMAWIDPFLDEPAEGHVQVAALPFYHIYGLTCCCLFMAARGGCCLLITNPRDIDGFVKTLRGSRFTITTGVNTLYNALANHPDIGKVDFSQLAYANAGGMAMQQAVAAHWKQLTGRPVVEGYGLSETSPVVSINQMNLKDFSGTIGLPVPSTEVVVRGSDGQDMPLGEAGELCVRGPQIMAGYWQRPEETAKALTADGYFRTGDVAMMLPNGELKIVDRMKDMVLVSGFNVYPNEVEDVLAMHPGVLEAAVIGVPDAHSGEVVTAYVVRKDPALTEAALRAHCRGLLTAYKVPRRVVFRDSLPKTNVGKVLRRVLRDEALAETEATPQAALAQLPSS